MNILQKLGLLIFVLATLSFTTVKKKDPKITIDGLKKHVAYLSSDQLKGRLTGSEGDSLSADYIRKQLKASGLVPLYSNGFQRFRVTDNIILGPTNEMTVNGTKLKVETDFAPFSFSQNNSFKGEVVFAGYGFSINEDSLKWNDYDGMDVKGKIVMVLRADPEVDKNTSPFIRYSRDRDKVLQAKDLGATAVLLVSGKVFDSEDKFEALVKGEQSVGIPAIRITRKIANQLLEPQKAVVDDLEKKLNTSRKPSSFVTGVSISGRADVAETTVATRNVVMVLPGEDPVLKNEYIILGGHFDHLGMGGKGSSSRQQDTVGVHHGADDNASGVGMVIELAKKLAATPNSHKRSILVMAFSGEEMGLLGSKQFVDHPEIDLTKVNAMVNLDMVGRLNENSMVQIGGVGTAEPLKKLIYADVDTTVLKLSLSEEGYGPSDHASFYGKNIPVLFISTGAHLDYHTPADTWQKINFPGMVKVANVTYKMVTDLANMDTKLAYLEAGPKEQVSRGLRKKGVTLGIMPDFAGNVKNGLRADFVTPGKPGALGGLKKGDIITSINGKEVNNIQDYMFRMSQLKHGETISVEVLRGTEKVVLLIQL